MNQDEQNQLEFRHPVLSKLTDEELIEVAAAVNSTYPGQNELAKKICTKVFFGKSPTISLYVGMSCALALEIAIRFKAAKTFMRLQS